MSHKYAVDTERAKECGRLLEELKDFIEEMSPNEVKFVEDMSERYAKFQEKTFVSDAQYQWLSSIYSRILE